MLACAVGTRHSAAVSNSTTKTDFWEDIDLVSFRMVYKIFFGCTCSVVLHARECSSTCRLPLDFPQDRIPRPHAHDPLALSTACYKIVKIRSSDKTSNPNSRILNSEGSKPFLGGGKSSQINIPLTLGCQSVG